MENFHAIIIGAGPSGMMATIRAAEKDRKILLLERNNAPGKKLLLTGNGRCNLTNSRDMAQFLSNFSETGIFLRNAFAKFFNTDLISFFENSGVKMAEETDNKIYPKTGGAIDILNALKSKLDSKNIQVLYKARAREIIIENSKVKGVITDSGDQFYADNVVIATGGLSYPETGSTGDGIKFALKAGHTIMPPQPALAPVLIKENFIKEWQGLSFEKVSLSLFLLDKKIEETFGDIIFTHFGLSGPAILDISASVYSAYKSGKTELSINFLPEINSQEIDSYILKKFKENTGKTIRNTIKIFIPDRMTDKFLEICNIDPDKKINQVTSLERKIIGLKLTDFRLTAAGVMPMKTAMATKGGVNIKEINPKTMQSKLIKGLFFTGEVIDIDAKSGGYNLQAAFSTGWVCGDNL